MFLDKDYELNSNSSDPCILPAAIRDLLATAIVCNVLDDKDHFDRAFLELLARCGIDVISLREKHGLENCEGKIQFPMTSRRKRMSTIISNATGNGEHDKRLFCKGAL